jgi:hypothetical protein
MKLPMLKIPLCWFAAVGSFLAAILFGLASIDDPQKMEQLKFNRVNETVMLCAAAVTLVCSIALVFRKVWARNVLVWTLSTLAVTLVAGVIYHIAAEPTTHKDDESLMFWLASTLFLLMVLALLVAFLLNRPLVNELLGGAAKPNQPDAANPAVTLGLTVEDQRRRAADLVR